MALLRRSKPLDRDSLPCLQAVRLGPKFRFCQATWSAVSLRWRYCPKALGPNWYWSPCASGGAKWNGLRRRQCPKALVSRRTVLSATLLTQVNRWEGVTAMLSGIFSSIGCASWACEVMPVIIRWAVGFAT